MPPKFVSLERVTMEYRIKAEDERRKAIEEAQWRAHIRKEERKISFRLKKNIKKFHEIHLSHEAEIVCLSLILLLTSVAAHAWITTAWLIYIR